MPEMKSPQLNMNPVTVSRSIVVILHGGCASMGRIPGDAGVSLALGEAVSGLLLEKTA